MPFESEADAAQQLYDSVLEDGNARSDEQEMHGLVEAAKEPVVVKEGVEEGVTAEPDTFTKIDPSTLPEELIPIYHSMQGDYTRKTQQVADERKSYEQLEEFGGLDTALEAIQFATNLATDPNYALQVHTQLTEALTQAGLTPAQASQEAAKQVEAVVAQSDDFAFGDDEYGDNPAVKSLQDQLSSQRTELENMQAWRKDQEDRAFNMQLANEMARQENAILTANPSYTEQDMEKVYTLSYAYGGNLEQANQVYEQLRNDTIAEYVQKKGAVSTGVGGVQGTGIVSAEEGFHAKDLFDPALTRLVNERIAQEIAAG